MQSSPREIVYYIVWRIKLQGDLIAEICGTCFHLSIRYINFSRTRYQNAS